LAILGLTKIIAGIKKERDGMQGYPGNGAYLGLARTIYIRFIYGSFGREITKHTAIYSVYIRFWPALGVSLGSGVGWMRVGGACMLLIANRVGQKRICTPCMTVYYPGTQYPIGDFPAKKYLIYTVYIWFWPTLITAAGCAGVGLRVLMRQGLPNVERMA
jgi:hypothetical protein